MTDRQEIDRLKRLIKTMFIHIYDGCTDYDPSDSFGGCDDCRHARHGRYECARLENIKSRMEALGIDWREWL